MNELIQFRDNLAKELYVDAIKNWKNNFFADYDTAEKDFKNEPAKPLGWE